MRITTKRRRRPMNDFKKALMKAQTADEFFKIFSEHYDLKNCKLNLIQLGTLVGNIDKLITVCGAKPKKK